MSVWASRAAGATTRRGPFRSLAIARGAQRTDLDLITPSPKEAKDVYTRMEKVWPALCRAVLAIELTAPDVSPGSQTGIDGEVAQGIAVAPAAQDRKKEKARRLAGLGLFTT